MRRRRKPVRRSRRKRRNPLTRREAAKILKWARSLEHLDRTARKAGDRPNQWLRGQATALRGVIREIGGTSRDPSDPVYERRVRYRHNPPLRRPRPGQRILGAKILGWGEAARYPGYAAAVRAYKRFHKAAPVHATRVRIADGTSRVTRRAVVLVGEAPSIEYQTVPNQKASNKAGRRGRKITWKHRMGEEGGKRPLIVHDPRSGVSSLIGGTYKVSDWYRH